MACTGFNATQMGLPSWITNAWCSCYNYDPPDLAAVTDWGRIIGAYDPSNPSWTSSGNWNPNAPSSTCPSGGQPCGSNSDCPSGQTCNNGQCSGGSPAPITCTGTGQSTCPTGQTCQNGQCVASTTPPPSTSNPFDFGSFFNQVFSNPGTAFSSYPGAAAVSLLGAIIGLKVALK